MEPSRSKRDANKQGSRLLGRRRVIVGSRQHYGHGLPM